MSILKKTAILAVSSSLLLSACDNDNAKEKKEIEATLNNLSTEVVETIKSRGLHDNLGRFIEVEVKNEGKFNALYYPDSVLIEKDKAKNIYIYCVDKEFTEELKTLEFNPKKCLPIDGNKFDKERFLSSLFDTYKPLELNKLNGSSDFSELKATDWSLITTCEKADCEYPENYAILHKSKAAIVHLNTERSIICQTENNTPFKTTRSIEEIQSESICLINSIKNEVSKNLVDLTLEVRKNDPQIQEQLKKNKEMDEFIETIEKDDPEYFEQDLPIYQESTARLLKMHFENGSFNELTKENQETIDGLYAMLERFLKQQEYSYLDLCNSLNFSLECQENGMRKEEVLFDGLDVFLWQDMIPNEDSTLGEPSSLRSNVIIFAIGEENNEEVPRQKFFFDLSLKPEFEQLFNDLKATKTEPTEPQD